MAVAFGVLFLVGLNAFDLLDSADKVGYDGIDADRPIGMASRETRKEYVSRRWESVVTGTI